MPDENQLVDYFAILDVMQSISIHRIDQPVKTLILFHSLHAGIYYAVWYGLFDTLEVLATKFDQFDGIDLISAETDYS